MRAPDFTPEAVTANYLLKSRWVVKAKINYLPGSATPLRERFNNTLKGRAAELLCTLPNPSITKHNFRTGWLMGVGLRDR